MIPSCHSLKETISSKQPPLPSKKMNGQQAIQYGEWKNQACSMSRIFIYPPWKLTNVTWKGSMLQKKHLPTIIFQGIFLSFQGSNTVDGRNHAPVDMVNLTLFTWFYTSQVAVWYFFHQQYVVIYQPKGKFLGMRNHRNLRLTSFTNTLMVS